MKAYHKSKPSTERRFTGEYAEDGKANRLAVRAEAGHRCIRCCHPFRTGETPPKWSPCDSQCDHLGPCRVWVVTDDDGDNSHWWETELSIVAGKQIKDGVRIESKWRVLTVHHLTGEKDNDQWWNCLALCQRCHLQIQTRVDPRTPWFLEHSDWFKPYVAGFYAHKYEGKAITREEAMERLDELLAYEFKA